MELTQGTDDGAYLNWQEKIQLPGLRDGLGWQPERKRILKVIR